MTALRTAADSRRWMDEGTSLFQAVLARQDDAALHRECALPGWTGRHLVAHVAANADALLNLVRWAATDTETPMYSSPQQRAADIAAGAERPPDQLRRWVAESSGRLAGALDDLTEDQWNSEVRTAQGRLLLATEIPWLRAREVLVHAVDLGSEVGFADLPEDFEVALIADVVAKRSASGDHPSLLLRADGHEPWAVTGGGAPTEVHGTVAGLAAYLTGRADPERPASAPELPAWL